MAIITCLDGAGKNEDGRMPGAKVAPESRVIMVGDSLTSDMQGGRNAGIATCRYLGDHPHEDSDLVDFEIKNYDEFFNILF